MGQHNPSANTEPFSAAPVLVPEQSLQGGLPSLGTKHIISAQAPTSAPAAPSCPCVRWEADDGKLSAAEGFCFIKDTEEAPLGISSDFSLLPWAQ